MAVSTLTPGYMPAEGATDVAATVHVNIDNMLKVKPAQRPDFTRDELPKLRAAQAAEAAAEAKAKEEADAQAKAQADALAAEQAASAQVTYYAAPVAVTPSYNSAGNLYDWGQCTWYVKNRRPDIPNNWGNAGSWLYAAQADGYATGYQPRAGAIGTESGHVVYVESVNGDGTVNISEMNWNGGVGVTHYRTTSRAEFVYIY